MTTSDTPQTVVARSRSDRGNVVAMDSAYHVAPHNRDRDVCVNASYCGVLPARFLAEHRPRGAIGMDCGVGPEGSAIAGLWFLEALSIPAAVADVMSAHLGDGIHLYRHGVISYANQPARDRGVECGMTVADAAERLLEHDAPTHRAAADITNRTIMYSDGDRHVIATDSIAFALPEDRDRNVLVTAGHTGRSAVPYLLQAQPHGFICSDGGRGMDDSGIVGLVMVETHGLAGATVDARYARMGSGMSHYHDGVISAANVHAIARGVRVGMPCSEAARILLLNS